MEIQDIQYIPISALKGDNVVDKSDRTSWYKGSTLLYTLENVHIASDYNFVDCRFPVQRVIRPQSDEFHDFRGYAGRIEGGIFKEGDEVVSLPSGFTSKIKSINTMNGLLEEAYPPMNVVIQLEDEIDISRGDMIVKENNQSETGQDIELMICWLNDKGLLARWKICHQTYNKGCKMHYKRYQV